jgi:hypothetical protein
MVASPAATFRRGQTKWADPSGRRERQDGVSLPRPTPAPRARCPLRERCRTKASRRDRTLDVGTQAQVDAHPLSGCHDAGPPLSHNRSRTFLGRDVGQQIAVNMPDLAPADRTPARRSDEGGSSPGQLNAASRILSPASHHSHLLRHPSPAPRSLPAVRHPSGS